MRTPQLTTLVLGLLLCTACASDDPTGVPGRSHPLQGSWYGVSYGDPSEGFDVGVRIVQMTFDGEGALASVQYDGKEFATGETTEIASGQYEVDFDGGARGFLVQDGDHLGFFGEHEGTVAQVRAALQRGTPGPTIAHSNDQIYSTEWSGHRIDIRSTFSIAGSATSDVTVHSGGDYRGVSGQINFLNNDTAFGNQLRYSDQDAGLLQGGYSEGLSNPGLILWLLSPDGKFAVVTCQEIGIDWPHQARFHALRRN